MIAQKVILPTVAVFIENPSSESRRVELPANPIFTQVLAKELVPFVEKQLNIKTKERIIGGSSYGGLSSAYTVLNYPNVFSKALILSGSFWWQPKGTPSEQSHYIAQQFIQKKNYHSVFSSVQVFMKAGNRLFVSGRIILHRITLNFA